MKIIKVEWCENFIGPPLRSTTHSLAVTRELRWAASGKWPKNLAYGNVAHTVPPCLRRSVIFATLRPSSTWTGTLPTTYSD